MKLTLVLAVAMLVFGSCKKEPVPYSKFKNTDYVTIAEETIDVDLNSHYYLIVESSYKHSAPRFIVRKNIEAEQTITDSSFVTPESNGWNGKERLLFKNVRIHFDFNSNDYNQGDQLRFSSRHFGVSESITFNIQ